MKPLPIKIITGATVVKPDGETGRETVIVEGSRIRQLTHEAPGGMLLSHEDVEVINAEGAYLTCGLIDQHINGALMCNFNQTSLPALQQALKLLPHHGVTGILPTVITAATMDMVTAIGTLEEAIHHRKGGHSRILGLHLEGPFIHPDYRGTHPSTDIAGTMNLADLETLLSPNTRLVSLAPEKDPDGSAIRHLVEKDIRVCAGHSNATVEEMHQCIGYGVSGVTHLYNAMRPFHHREPGIVGVTLAHRELYAELIADGVHVHPEAIKATLNAKGPGRIILVSDAMQLAGAEEGTSVSFAGTRVTLTEGQALNTAGKLAGAAQLLNVCVRNMVRWNVTDFPTAIRMATQTPAEYLGLQEYGRLAPGYMADLVLWNEKTLDITAAWVGGQQVYDRQKSPA